MPEQDRASGVFENHSEGLNRKNIFWKTYK